MNKSEHIYYVYFLIYIGIVGQCTLFLFFLFTLAILTGCFELNWDRGCVNCGASSFVGVDSLD